jgi:hypothetical protein
MVALCHALCSTAIVHAPEELNKMTSRVSQLSALKAFQGWCASAGIISPLLRAGIGANGRGVFLNPKHRRIVKAGSQIALIPPSVILCHESISKHPLGKSLEPLWCFNWPQEAQDQLGDFETVNHLTNVSCIAAFITLQLMEEDTNLKQDSTVINSDLEWKPYWDLLRVQTNVKNSPFLSPAMVRQHMRQVRAIKNTDDVKDGLERLKMEEQFAEHFLASARNSSIELDQELFRWATSVVMSRGSATTRPNRHKAHAFPVEDLFVIPFYDLCNHAAVECPDATNRANVVGGFAEDFLEELEIADLAEDTDGSDIDSTNYFHLYAMQDIHPGQEIFIDYTGGHGWQESQGTSFLLSYGFTPPPLK